MFKLRRTVPKNERLTQYETPASTFIPYKCLYNSNTILTKDDKLVRVVKIKGFSFETADDEDIDIKKDARNNLLKGMAVGTLSLYFHTVRRKEKGFPDGVMPDKFSKRLDDEWAQRHTDQSYINEHYISIIRGKEKTGIAKIESAIKTIQSKADKSLIAKELNESFNEIEEMTERVLNGFSNYSPEILGLSETEDGIYSDLLGFLCQLINPGYSQPIAVGCGDIASQLPISRMYFGSKTIEIHNPDKIKYAGIVSIKEYRPSTNAGVFDGFMQMPCEIVISQSLTYIDRMFAISSMQLQQRRLVQSEDVAVSQIQEIDEALDSAMSGEFAFGNHFMSVMCIDDSAKSLESSLSLAIVELSNAGITGIREKINMEPAFWAQLPCNEEYMARRCIVNTKNIAAFASFHNYPSGKRKRNHWGDAVTVLDTASGTPFFFNFHVRDVGHTMIIGPTGAGKTVLLNFLCAQAQKFNGRLFFFDKDRGAEIFIRAIRGKYIIPSTAQKSGFNPLQLDDTPENRSFLVEFISVLVSHEGDKITPEDIERINEAINGNYKLPKSQRRLRNIAPFLGLGGPGSLAGRFAMWHTDGSHANLFDNEEDKIDFNIARTFGIEMAAILQDTKSTSPVLLYLFHRIQSSLDGSPTMIVLDEAWALIGNKVFAPKIKDWLKVLRKLNTFVVFATQSVEDASKSEISDTLVQQTATQIFLPNLKATSVYREVFMLSEREFAMVKTTDPSTRFFLIKQDNDGVMCRINLSGMDEIINVLSGRVDTVIILAEIIKEVGDDPDVWLPIFLEKTN